MDNVDKGETFLGCWHDGVSGLNLDGLHFSTVGPAFVLLKLIEMLLKGQGC